MSPTFSEPSQNISKIHIQKHKSTSIYVIFKTKYGTDLSGVAIFSIPAENCPN